MRRYVSLSRHCSGEIGDTKSAANLSVPALPDNIVSRVVLYKSRLMGEGQ